MIVNLKVYNFKGIEKAEISCKKVTLFVGRSRQGKTSMLKSVGWCIAGGTRNFNVHMKANEARVTCETERAVFDRVYVRGSKKDRISVTKKDDGATVDPKIALSNFSDLCFDPISFVFLSPKDQSKIIREALAGKLELSEKEAEELGIELVDETGQRTTKDAKTICEEAYKRYYNERTAVNAQVDMMKQKMSGAKLDFIPDENYIKNLEQNASDLQTLMDNQLQKNARINAAKGNEATRQKLQDQLTTLDTSIAEAEKNDSVDTIEKLTETVSALDTKFAKDSAEENELRASATMLKKTLETLQSAEFPVCPISNKITCVTSMNSVKESMQTELDDLNQQILNKHNTNLSMSEEIESLRTLIENKRNAAKMKVERDRVKVMIDNLTIADSILEDVEATKNKLAEKLSELTTAKVAKDLAALGDIEEKIKKQRDLDNKVKNLRSFIDTELTKRAKLEINDVEVKDDGIYFRNLPLSEECTSVQLRVSCAIMKALYPKNKLILTDRLEILDKNTLSKFLQSYAQSPDGVQLIGTYVGEDVTFLKGLNNIQIIEMNAGSTKEI